MHKFLWSLIALVMLGVAPFAHAEIIRSFSSDITLTKDAGLIVVEEIVYDFGADERHGIFRSITTTHPEPARAWHQKRYIDIEVKRVMRNGVDEPFTIIEEASQDVIKIGAADSTISGSHTYTIEYSVLGALSYPRDTYPEIYWNATGNEWEVPILSARATLRDPDSILRGERSCYSGTEGSRASCIISASTTGIIFTASNLGPSQGMTFANAIESGSVEKVTLEKNNLAMLIPLAIAGALTVLTALVAYTLYRYRTKHKQHLPVVAQYESYAGMLPMYTGVLSDGRLDPRDITAAILYLAEQGYLKIRKTERTVFFLFEVSDYEIEIVKDLPVAAPQFSKDILSLISAYPNPGTVITLSELAKDTTHARANAETIERLKSDAVEDLTSTGFYEFIFAAKDIPLSKWPSFLAKPGLIAVGMVLLFLTGFILLVVIGVALIAIFSPWNLRRLTRKGYEAVNHLEGYKLYLSVAEEDRINFHNAPEKSPEEFLAHLPYAIAFGVEEKWAEAFKDITMPSPAWYQDTQGAHFDAISIGHSFGAFSTAFASSSGTSASSGGGSSGGGAGGGGGGSW